MVLDKRAAADDDDHALCVLGEVHGGLAGRVRSPYDVNNLAFARQSFAGAAAVIDTGSLQTIDSGSFEPPPLHSRRDHQGVAGELVSVGQFNEAIGAFGSHADGLLRRQNFYTKTLRLHHRAPGQIGSTEPHGESKIVLDARAHASLTAGGFALNHHRVQALGRSINGSSQAGRASTHDGQVIKVGLGACPQTNPLGYVGWDTFQKLGAVREKYDRKTSGVGPQNFQETLGFRVIGGKLDVNPLIGNSVARQEISQLVGPGRPARP